jgi:beta-lactam-binding protein with PASTA domain
MPELVGLPHGDAYERARAVQGELDYFATTETADCNRNTDRERFGVVYDQTPDAGTPLRQGTPITLRYYAACTRVPAITGLQLDEAQVALRTAGLQAAGSTTCVAGVPPYVVVSQDPQPGGIVPEGSTVAFTVNSGCRD